MKFRRKIRVWSAISIIAWSCQIGPAQAELVASVLPASRSIQTGESATAFATIINIGSETLSGCRISLPPEQNLDISFQTTDALTNTPIGSQNSPANVLSGVAQSFVFTVTPSGPVAPTDLPIVFSCDGQQQAGSLSGINTLLFSASEEPVPDIVALVATATNNGVLEIPDKIGAFSVATVNVGAVGTLNARAKLVGTDTQIDLSICQTDILGACINPAQPTFGTVIFEATEGATSTFSIFASTSSDIVFDPGGTRIFIEFLDASETTRGATSVALTTTSLIAPEQPSPSLELEKSSGTFRSGETMQFQAGNLLPENAQYAAEIDGSLEAKLLLIGKDRLAFLVPPLSIGAHELSTTIDGKRYDLPFEIVPPETIDNPEEFISNFVAETESQLTEIATLRNLDTSESQKLLEPITAFRSLLENEAPLSIEEFGYIANLLLVNTPAEISPLDQPAGVLPLNAVCTDTKISWLLRLKGVSTTTASLALGLKLSDIPEPARRTKFSVAALGLSASAGLADNVPEAFSLVPNIWHACASFEAVSLIQDLTGPLNLNVSLNRSEISNVALPTADTSDLTFVSGEAQLFGLQGTKTLPYEVAKSLDNLDSTVCLIPEVLMPRLLTEILNIPRLRKEDVLITDGFDAQENSQEISVESSFVGSQISVNFSFLPDATSESLDFQFSLVSDLHPSARGTFNARLIEPEVQELSVFVQGESAILNGVDVPITKYPYDHLIQERALEIKILNGGAQLEYVQIETTNAEEFAGGASLGGYYEIDSGDELVIRVPWTSTTPLGPQIMRLDFESSVPSLDGDFTEIPYEVEAPPIPALDTGRFATCDTELAPGEVYVSIRSIVKGSYTVTYGSEQGQSGVWDWEQIVRDQGVPPLYDEMVCIAVPVTGQNGAQGLVEAEDEFGQHNGAFLYPE